MNKGVLYLIPVSISDGSNRTFFPEINIEIIKDLNLFFVENIRSARRAIKKLCPQKDISTISFIEIGKHSKLQELEAPIMKMEQGLDAGVISEAGCPGIADPGAYVVRIAHQKDIRVIPLIGPSSILLALMASGLNGQKFTFNGYLPRENTELKQKLKQLESQIKKEEEAQLFIETPYRNQKLFDTLLSLCPSHLRLCIAQDITGKAEHIKTCSIAEWKKKPFVFEKLPSLFILGI